MFLFVRNIGEEAWRCGNLSYGIERIRVIAVEEESGSEQIVLCDGVVKAGELGFEGVELLTVVPLPVEAQFLDAEGECVHAILRAADECFPGSIRRRAVDAALADEEDEAEMSGTDFDQDECLKDMLQKMYFKEDLEESCAAPVSRYAMKSFSEFTGTFTLSDAAQKIAYFHGMFQSACTFLACVHRPSLRCSRVTMAYSHMPVCWLRGIGGDETIGRLVPLDHPHAVGRALLVPSSHFPAPSIPRKRVDARIFTLNGERSPGALAHGAGKNVEETVFDMKKRHASGTMTYTVPPSRTVAEFKDTLRAFGSNCRNGDLRLRKVVNCDPSLDLFIAAK